MFIVVTQTNGSKSRVNIYNINHYYSFIEGSKNYGNETSFTSIVFNNGSLRVKETAEQLDDMINDMIDDDDNDYQITLPGMN